MKKLTLILALVIAFVACKKDETAKIEEGNYLMFGHFYGMCVGDDCVEIFKLTSEKLYKDLNSNYPGQPPYNFSLLEDNQFNAVKDLPTYLPPELLADTNTYFGCPDCADQGGLFIEYKNGEGIKNWRIDQNISQVPEYLHSFIDKVNEKIGVINN